MTLTAYISTQIFDGQLWHHEHALLVQGAQIVGLCPLSEIPQNAQKHDLGQDILCPGFVDLQVNGGDGVLFNDTPDVETLTRMGAAHIGLGATSILPTLITDTPEHTKQALRAVEQAIANNVAGIIGIHLEGPHLSVARRGAHMAQYVRPMDDADEALLSEYAQRLPVLKMTIAAENVTVDQAKRLVNRGVLLSLGHSDASYDEAQRLIDVGVHCATHVFNAMSPITNRAPGVTGAILSDARVSAGVIADGIHVHPAALAIGFSAKASHQGDLFLVSDAMAPAGTSMDRFSLNGREIIRQAGQYTLEDGTLAGADLTLPQAIRFLVGPLGRPLDDALARASSIPAKLIGQSHLVGCLSAGARADFLQMTPQAELVSVWACGQMIEPRIR